MTIKEVSDRYGISPDTLRYYERVGVIPEVGRTASGIRNYTEEDLKWVQNAICFRSAGMPVEMLIEYVRLCRQGDSTIAARRDLLTEARAGILEAREKYDRALEKLDYKISRYEEAVRTGRLAWDAQQERSGQMEEIRSLFAQNNQLRRISRMENRFFQEIKKNFGFGCMRLPLLENGEVDKEEYSRMIERYFAAGFNYFDTAHGYLDGKSELTIRDCLTSKYPRDSYILTNKLTNYFFKSQEEIRPLFEKQLECCGVEYFDFYLMHAQGKDNFAHFKKCHAYETALKLKEEGKFRHFGISFHDTADVLEQILSEYPQIEVVQIQLNYVDYEDPAVQSRKLLEVCRKYGKPVIVMEPVKGGSLVRLPQEAQEIFDGLHGCSNAGYAIRFAAGCDPVMMVLSGMSNLEQMEDNVSFMEEFQPLDEQEQEAVEKVCGIFRSKDIIPCTACRYCTAGCPQQISIPDLFACMNAKNVFGDWNQNYYYNVVYTGPGRKASDCLKCGKCEKACPQHLPIRKLLEDVVEVFEKEGA